MQRSRDERRVPQPQTRHGEDLAAAIWKRRHVLEVAMENARNLEAHLLKVTPALSLRLCDSTHEQYAMKTRERWREHGSCSVQYDGRCYVTSDDRARWALHAWRAAQAARLLVALDEDAGAGDEPLCHPRKPSGRFARMLPRPWRPLTMAEVLEDRLDTSIASRIGRLPDDVIVTGTFEIGGGVMVDGNVYAPILAVSHEDHGTMSLAGRAAEALAARIDAMIEHDAARTEIQSMGSSLRLDRLVAACREAIEMDPDMTDAAGTPIRPLLERHLPRLEQRRAAAGPDGKLDEETDAVLAQVARAVEQGMATHARARRDALRTELHFLAQRHPDSTLSTV